MPQASTYQCPNCSGVLSFDAATGLLTCGFCGASFHQGEVEKAIPISDAPVQAKATDHVKTIDEFLEHAPWDVEGENAVGYSCPSCGAGVVANQSAVTASCPYCGNNMVVSGIATASNVPQWVLPFSITREQAEAELRHHFEGKRYLSRKFSASIEHMQGVYVPYHLFDMRVSGYANYIGAHEESGSDGTTNKSYNAMHRAGYAAFERIPVDGSSKMPDAHMDAIAPFHFEALRAFSTSYVAGYLTEVPDETPEECLPRAEARVRNSFEGDLKKGACAENDASSIERVVSHETRVSLEGVSSCVLPVWLMHCTWDDTQMLFAVNGETGKCVGDLPVDKKRRVTTICVTALIVFVIAMLIAMLLSFGRNGDAPYGNMALFAVIAITWLIDQRNMAQMRSVEEAHDAGMSYTSEGLVVTERWSTGKFYTFEKKAIRKLQEYLDQ